MQSRYRGNYGNGYRWNHAASGLSTRISPEGSLRGHWLYNSDCGSFNRGNGRIRSKPCQQLDIRRRGSDVFMEAGRLAAEYLVSQGMLPSNSLSMKPQVSNLKSRMGNNQEFKFYDGMESQNSAIARSGNAVSDGELDRRWHHDEYSTIGSHDPVKGRRKLGHFRSNDSNSIRENGKNDSLLNKSGALVNIEGDVCHQGKDAIGSTSTGKSLPNELAPKTDSCYLESKSEKFNNQDIMALETSNGVDEDPSLATNVDLYQTCNNSGILSKGTWELKDDTCTDEVDKHSHTENIHIQNCAVECEREMENVLDLQKLCRFANIPTRTRSSVANKCSKVDPPLIIEEDINPDANPLYESRVSTENDYVNTSLNTENDHIDASLDTTFSNTIQGVKCPESDISETALVHYIDDVGVLSPTYSKKHNESSTSNSFTKERFMYKQESVLEPLPEFGMFKSIIEESVKKRAPQHNDMREETKKARHWLPPVGTLDNEYNNLSILKGKEPSSQERKTPFGDDTVTSIDHDTSMDISLFSKGGDEPSTEYNKGKQHFPCLFKICDLNLMEVSNMNENHHNNSNPILIPHLNPENKTEVVSADIDFPVITCNVSEEHVGRGTDSKKIEVIDLENDFAEVDKVTDNLEIKEKIVFTPLDEFRSNMQNPSNISDVQDGYSLMASDLHIHDIGDCSSVPADINSLHNDMGLHRGEGILGDDDSIYMSLGEIPISMPDI